MPNKQPTFAERTQSMQAIANNLLATANLLSKFAADIAAEADRMAAAAKRFAEARPEARTASLRVARRLTNRQTHPTMTTPYDEQHPPESWGHCPNRGQPLPEGYDEEQHLPTPGKTSASTAGGRTRSRRATDRNVARPGHAPLL